MKPVKLVIALHGNPGRGSDLAPLTAPFWGRGLTVEAPTRPQGGASLPELLDAIERGRAGLAGDEVCLLGYSWGAWLALRYASAAADPPGHLALIAPYLVATKPVSPIVKALLAVPVLGTALLKSSAAKTRERYIADSFAPETPDEVAREQLRGTLTDPAVWRGALAYKGLLEAAPLGSLAGLRARLLVVRGADDAVAPWEVHRAPLAPALGGATEHALAGAGHALPWSRTSEASRLVLDWLAPPAAASP